jgi:predicted kinase
VTDRPLPPLQPFSCTGSLFAGSRQPPAAIGPAIETVVYRGAGWIGGRMADVVCTRAGGIYVVRIEGLPPLRVDQHGCAVGAEGAPAALTATLLEALLGPGLILALALHDTFALHAGAATCGGGVAVLLGASGAGKSTIACSLARTPGGAPLADDVLPVDIHEGRLSALPHYPQLKLPLAAQYRSSAPERVPVAAVYELCGVAGTGPSASVEAVDRRDAAVLLAAQTVAARLFDAALLTRHLAFCAAVAMAVPVRRLRFTKQLDSLPAIAATIAADLAALAR